MHQRDPLPGPTPPRSTTPQRGRNDADRAGRKGGRHDRTGTLRFGVCAFVALLPAVATSNALPQPGLLPTHLDRFQGLADHFAAHPELQGTRSSGWKPYQRALWFAETRPVANGFSAQELRAAAAARRTAALSTSAGRGSGSWFSVGPTELSGRCTAIAFDPLDSQTVYVGSASGGLWKSQDGGGSWSPLTDEFSTLAVGAVCVVTAAPSVVLLGTGEGSGAGYGPFGEGLFRSTDGGASWNPTNLSYPSGTFHGFNHIEENPLTGTLLAGASDGLYRSVDQGATWAQVAGNGNYYDIVWKPGSPGTVFVSKGRDPFTNFQNDNGVKISTDDGLTFVPAGSGQPAGFRIGKTKLAVSPADPQMLYAHYVDAADWGSLGVYRSADGGATWQLRNGSLNMTGAQGWYNLVLAVDPEHPDVVITGGVHLYRSTNGGIGYDALNADVPFGNATTPHWDEHALRYAPGRPNEVWVACDGGIWRSTDDGATWDSRREGLITYQFYDICVAQSDPWFAMGGTQDNGIPGRTGFSDWFQSTFVADGMVCNIDPINRNVVYAEYQFGGHIKSLNGGLNWFNLMNGITGTGSWVTPVDLDLQDARHLYTMTNAGIFRTRNGGQLWENVAAHTARWISISPVDGRIVWTISNTGAVWRTDDDGGSWVPSPTFPATGLETKIQAHPAEPGGALVTVGGYGTGTPRVLRTTDAGHSWFDVSGDLPDVPVNTLVVDPDQAGDWYVGTDVGVWRSTDGGSTWIPWGNDLANATIVDLEIRRADRRLVAGTHGRGMWEIEIPLDPTSAPSAPSAGSTNGHLLFDPPRPNPVTSSTVLRVAAHATTDAALEVFDSAGRLVSEAAPVPGDGVVRMIRWEAGDLPAGVYHARLRAGHESLTRKIVVDRARP